MIVGMGLCFMFPAEYFVKKFEPGRVHRSASCSINRTKRSDGTRQFSFAQKRCWLMFRFMQRPSTGNLA